nr:hypothetical protein [Tolivirales sp.]
MAGDFATIVEGPEIDDLSPVDRPVVDNNGNAVVDQDGNPRVATGPSPIVLELSANVPVGDDVEDLAAPRPNFRARRRAKFRCAKALALHAKAEMPRMSDSVANRNVLNSFIVREAKKALVTNRDLHHVVSWACLFYWLPSEDEMEINSVLRTKTYRTVRDSNTHPGGWKPVNWLPSWFPGNFVASPEPTVQ